MKYLVISDIHGSNYYAKKIDEIVNNEKPDKIILCTRGNCDADVDEMISEFEFKDSIELELNNKKFFFTHGHKYNIDNIPQNIDVLIYGHFHTGFIKEKDGIICVNAGSISLPKNDTAHSYLIINDNVIILKDIDDNIIDKKDYID